MRRYFLRGHALDAAVHDVAVHRCLDLKRHRGDRVLADVQEFSAEHADPPVVGALHELLDDDPVRHLDEPSCDPEEPGDIHDLFDPSENEVEGSFTISGVPSVSKSSTDPFDREIVFREKDGFGSATFFFWRWRNMLILSPQIWMESASSMTGMPWKSAMRAATYVMFIGSVRARMKSASIFGILLISTGKRNSTLCPRPSATSRQWMRALSLLGIGEGFSVDKDPKPAHKNSCSSRYAVRSARSFSVRWVYRVGASDESATFYRLYKDHAHERDGEEFVDHRRIPGDCRTAPRGPAKDRRAGMDGCPVIEFLVAERVLALVCDMLDDILCLLVVLHDKEVGCGGKVVEAVEDRRERGRRPARCPIPRPDAGSFARSRQMGTTNASRTARLDGWMSSPASSRSRMDNMPRSCTVVLGNHMGCMVPRDNRKGIPDHHRFFPRHEVGMGCMAVSSPSGVWSSSAARTVARRFMPGREKVFAGPAVKALSVCSSSSGCGVSPHR